MGAADAVGTAEFADRHAIDRQTQMPAHVGEGDRRGQTAGVAKRGELRLGRIGGNGAGGIVRRADGRIETGFELGD